MKDLVAVTGNEALVAQAAACVHALPDGTPLLVRVCIPRTSDEWQCLRAFIVALAARLPTASRVIVVLGDDGDGDGGNGAVHSPDWLARCDELCTSLHVAFGVYVSRHGCPLLPHTEPATAALPPWINTVVMAPGAPGARLAPAVAHAVRSLATASRMLLVDAVPAVADVATSPAAVFAAGWTACAAAGVAPGPSLGWEGKV